MTEPDPRDRAILRLLKTVGILAAGLVIAALAVVALVIADGTYGAVAAYCPFFRDVAELPLTASTTQTGLTLVADSRIAFEKNCDGRLPALDPQSPVLPIVRAKGGY